MKKWIGPISLSVTVAGTILIQIGIHTHLLSGQIWHILLAGFEAGTVGGVADWFAVSALFHEIPIPFVKSHTNIIVKNRGHLTEGVIDLVINKWLSPSVIKEKISTVSIAGSLLAILNEPANKTRAIDFSRGFLEKLASNLDRAEVAAVLQTILKNQITGIDIATPFGRWLEKAIQRGDHVQVWEMILNAAQKTLNEPQTREWLLELIKQRAQEYKNESFIKNMFISLAEGIGAIDNQSIVDKLINSINAFLSEAKSNPGHSVRQRLDTFILEFAQNLVSGDKNSHDLFNGIKQKLVDNAEGQKIIQDVLSQFKSTVQSQLQGNNTPFMIMLTDNLNRLTDELQTDLAAQQKIDAWIKETITQLINRYHHEIGAMVRLSLSKLNDRELVAQIEEKVGNDLQYIRLNGAIVGGIAGMVIYTIQFLFC